MLHFVMALLEHINIPKARAGPLLATFSFLLLSSLFSAPYLPINPSNIFLSRLNASCGKPASLYSSVKASIIALIIKSFSDTFLLVFLDTMYTLDCTTSSSVSSMSSPTVLVVPSMLGFYRTRLLLEIRALPLLRVWGVLQ